MQTVSFKHKLITFLLYLLTALSFYYLTFRFDYFFFDDAKTFQENPSIYDPSNIKVIFLTFKTRFIPGFTFALNYAIGGIIHFWFRLTNIVIHGTNSFLVFLLAYELFNLAVARKQINWSSIYLPAFLTGLIFLVHPIQTEAVNLVVQRMTMMSTMFYMLASYLFIRFRITQHKGYFVFSFLSCVAAMFCKENAFTLPFMLLLIDFLFFSEHSLKWKRYFQHIPFLLTLLIIPLLLHSTSADMIHTARIASFSSEEKYQTSHAESLTGKIDITRAGHTGNFSRYHYFLTEINVLRTYMRLYLLPIDQQFLRDYPVSDHFLEWRTVLSAILLMSFILLAIRFRKTRTIVTVAILWFFTTLSIESSIIPIGHLIAEYRMYIAMFGLSLLFVYLVMANIRNFKLGIVLVSCVIFIFSWTSSSRSLDWQDEYSLWRDNYIKNPKDIRVVMSYARILTMQGETKRGLEYYKEILKLIGCESVLCQNMFGLYLGLGQYSDAAKVLKRMERELGRNFDYYISKGIFSATIKDYAGAIIYFKKAVEKDKQNVQARYYLCITYDRIKDVKGALACYDEAINVAGYEFNFYARKAFILFDQKDQKGYQDFLDSIRHSKHASFADKLDQAMQGISPLIQ